MVNCAVPAGPPGKMFAFAPVGVDGLTVSVTATAPAPVPLPVPVAVQAAKAMPLPTPTAAVAAAMPMNSFLIFMTILLVVASEWGFRCGRSKQPVQGQTRSRLIKLASLLRAICSSIGTWSSSSSSATAIT